MNPLLLVEHIMYISSKEEAYLNAFLLIEGHTLCLFDGLTHQRIATNKLHHLPQLSATYGSIDLNHIHHHLGTWDLSQSLVQRTHLNTRLTLILNMYIFVKRRKKEESEYCAGNIITVIVNVFCFKSILSTLS